MMSLLKSYTCSDSLFICPSVTQINCKNTVYKKQWLFNPQHKNFNPNQLNTKERAAPPAVRSLNPLHRPYTQGKAKRVFFSSGERKSRCET